MKIVLSEHTRVIHKAGEEYLMILAKKLNIGDNDREISVIPKYRYPMKKIH